MEWITIIGIIAAACTTGSFVPQVIKTIMTRDTKGISLLMYSFFSLGVLLWLVYGIVKLDFPIIVANAVTISLASIVLILKIKNG
jgi:MtN3 and saliva related transmembrane protein